MPLLSDIQTQTHGISLDALPVSAQQRNQLVQLLQALPQAQSDLVQVRDLLGAANWILGVNNPRTFLVQTMDRAELRGTGGFTGQYGELHIQGGRVAPFTLTDISLVEYTDSSRTLGQLAPPQYRSWWPFANWGLRDSNVSADFPTSAQTAINLYQLEVGHHVDGVILFTPFLIEHILQIIGPINVPGYNDTITAQNLEDRLHYYQQDNAGIAKQAAVQSGDTTTSERKRFTGLLAHLLLDKIRHAPPDELLAIGRETLHDLKTKDLQLYFNNPQVESLLAKYGYGSQIDRSTTHDGLFVVQANLSASKNSQYVQTIMHDTVTLELCGGIYQQCPQTGVYPHDELLCPAGQFQPGAAPPSITDPDGNHWHPLDTIGPPTSFATDEPGRGMFGGWVVVPKNCSMTITLSWYVPPMGHAPYTLLVQRQAGMYPELDLTVLPTPGDCAALKTTGLHFDGLMSEDMFFTPSTFKSTAKTASTACYPQPPT